MKIAIAINVLQIPNSRDCFANVYRKSDGTLTTGDFRYNSAAEAIEHKETSKVHYGTVKYSDYVSRDTITEAENAAKQAAIAVLNRKLARVVRATQCACGPTTPAPAAGSRY
jgi:hypothetical protein